MWKLFNKAFDSFKNFPPFRLLYRFSWAPSLYHFLIALAGAAVYLPRIHGIKVIGVTGTKGKTTTAELLAAIFEAGGSSVALLSSLRIKTGDKSEENLFGNTMPGRFFVQNFLVQAVAAQCEYAIVEVTSQGVLLHRHRFLPWGAAILTNIAPEHIEAHGSFEAYRGAKLAFLRYVARRGGEVFIDADDEPSRYFAEVLPSKCVSHYSTSLLSATPDSLWEVLPGKFNMHNVAAAVTLARHFGVSETVIRKGLGEFRGVPGRMEYVQRQPFSVVVDYAHTPDSLRSVYETLREANSKLETRNPKLICVLGSAGGGRDKWKRPEMGKIAAEYCDEIVLTNEDPWDENPSQIVSEIQSGISNFPSSANASAGEQLPISNVRTVIDRKEAICKAIEMAREGDAVVITGKGAEPYLHLADGVKVSWSDKVCVEEAINRRIANSE